MIKKYMLFCVMFGIMSLTETVLAIPQPEEPVYIPQQLLEDMTGNKWIPDQEKTRQRLNGLKGLVVLVDADMNLKLKKSPLGQQFDAIRSEIAQTLIGDLVAGGVPVVGYSAWKKSDTKPVLRFRYSFSETDFNVLYVSCEDQYVLQRNPERYKYLATWKDRDSFSCDTLFTEDTQSTKTIMLKEGRAIVKNFIQEFHEASPETSSAIPNIPQSPIGTEFDSISGYIADGDNQGLKGLACFLPALRIDEGREMELNPLNDRFFAFSEKIMNRYQMCLYRAEIPVTTLSQWEKDSAKAYMKIDMTMFNDFAMFTAVLYDKYSLKRAPGQIEYCNNWAYNQSLEGDKISQAKALNFFVAQSTNAFKEFVRDYKAANP